MHKNNSYPKTLFNYLIKLHLKHLITIFVIFFVLIFFIDFIELYRRTSNKIGFTDTEKVIFTELLFMTFLKAPNVMQKILPLTVLIGSIVTFLKWRQNNYFVIIRSIGISMWKMNDRNPFVEASVYRRLSQTQIQQACVTINQRFDPNCRCKKYKDQKTGNNACYKVNPYIQGYGPLGQSTVASQLIKSSNSLNQGNLTTGQLNSSDFIRAAARFKSGAGKLLKKINKNLKSKGKSPIPVSNKYTKKFLKASVAPNVISMAKSMASIPSGGLKPIKGPAAGVLRKMAKKAGVKTTNAITPGSIQKGEAVEELNFDLGTESTVKPKIVDDFLDKKYKIDREQIVKREDVSIWKVITNRYNLSGLPRLFGED